MTDRWHWDFDGEHRGKREQRETARSPLRPGPSREAQIRRRRRVLLVTLLALVAILIAAMPGSHKAAPSAATAPHAATVHKSQASVAPAGPATVASVLAYTPFIKKGSARVPDVALTFDDGPGPYTPGVLNVLEQMHVHATFFEIGKMLQYFSASTVREIRDGDVIGDHTETHPMMAHMSAHEQYEELFEQIARIELLGGPPPDLFRPPYGSFNATTFHELHKLHLLMVLWSVDTNDYLQPGVSVIVKNALEGAHPGAIILMHDAGGTRTETIEALPIIIRALRARGLKLVTIPELLRDDPPPHGQPLPTNLSGD
jgi:peptidoglycan/xylan/chitin deacetylase (PgdA/CDA1 family)